SAGRSEKPGAKNVEVHFRTATGKAQERVVVFVGCGLAVERHPSVVQSQSGDVVTEGDHNMDKTDARLVRLDDGLRDLALGLEFLQAIVYFGKLILQGGWIFRLAGCNLRSQLGALLLELKFLRIVRIRARIRWSAVIFQCPPRALHQLLLRQHAGLQSSNGRVDPRILLLGTTVEEDKDYRC